MGVDALKELLLGRQVLPILTVEERASLFVVLHHLLVVLGHYLWHQHLFAAS